MTNPLYQGDIEGALAFLSKNRQDFDRDIRQEIVNFTGVSDATAHHWIRGDSFPNGEPLIRLVAFLELSGFALKETWSLPSEICQMRQLIAFRVIEIDSTTDYLGYHRRDSLLRILFGKEGISAERREKMKQLVKEYSELLPDEMAKIRPLKLKTIHEKPQPELSEKEAPPAPAISAAAPKSDIISGGTFTSIARLKQQKMAEHTLIERSAIAMVRGLIPLAEAILAEKFSPEIRQDIIEINRSDLFQLIDLLRRIMEMGDSRLQIAEGEENNGPN